VSAQLVVLWPVASSPCVIGTTAVAMGYGGSLGLAGKALHTTYDRGRDVRSLPTLLSNDIIACQPECGDVISAHSHIEKVGSLVDLKC
jgi:hypothetical protein